MLQYYLCENNYSSIYKLIFSSYFSDKATLEFSEYQINKYITRARVASEENDWPNAIKDYNKALKLDNSLIEAKKGLTYSIKRETPQRS